MSSITLNIKGIFQLDILSCYIKSVSQVLNFCIKANYSQLWISSYKLSIVTFISTISKSEYYVPCMRHFSAFPKISMAFKTIKMSESLPAHMIDTRGQK